MKRIVFEAVKWVLLIPKGRVLVGSMKKIAMFVVAIVV